MRPTAMMICGGDVCSMVFFKVFCDYGGVYCCEVGDYV